VHVPIICSAGCAGFLAVDHTLPAPWLAMTAIVVTPTLSLAAAVPLVTFDAWWTRWLSAWFAGWFACSGREGARFTPTDNARVRRRDRACLPWQWRRCTRRPRLGCGPHIGLGIDQDG
jgi:hypothetical protein